MSDKNPYEIRLDVMKMAQDMLNEELKTRRQKFEYSVANMSTVNIGGVDKFIQDNYPKAYTTEELVQKSQELYKFIETTRGKSTINNVSSTVIDSSKKS